MRTLLAAVFLVAGCGATSAPDQQERGINAKDADATKVWAVTEVRRFKDLRKDNAATAKKAMEKAEEKTKAAVGQTIGWNLMVKAISEKEVTLDFADNDVRTGVVLFRLYREASTTIAPNGEKVSNPEDRRQCSLVIGKDIHEKATLELKPKSRIRVTGKIARIVVRDDRIEIDLQDLKAE